FILSRSNRSMLIRLALCMTSIFFSVSPASILTARMRQFSRVSKGGKTFSRMTFHSFSPREAEMLSVSPDENLAIPREKSRSTHVAQTVWYMIHLLVDVRSIYHTSIHLPSLTSWDEC